ALLRSCSLPDSFDPMLEGSFQAGHSRLRFNAESTALCGGGPSERKSLGPHFEAIVEHGLSARTRELLSRASATFWIDVRQLPSWTLRILSLRCTRRNWSLDSSRPHSALSVDALCAAFLFDRLVQAPQVSIQQLSKFVEKAKRLDVQCVRCLELLVVSETSSRTPLHETAKPVFPVQKVASEAPRLIAENLDLVSQEGVLLAKNINFEAVAGQPLLISGPAGCGKSVLASILLGLGLHDSSSRPRPPLQTVM
ncbi:unnamed protein product, partial [Polarella glacialis]